MNNGIGPPIRRPISRPITKGATEAPAVVSAPLPLPVKLTNASISGDPFPGEILTATPGTWQDADTVTGEWWFNMSPTGNTSTTFNVIEEAIGASITYRETATNEFGSRNFVSAAVSIILEVE